tara:strand:+ start:688 stop:879 length:192 start_codon:yes stop_codon:yes gene_type:complete
MGLLWALHGIPIKLASGHGKAGEVGAFVLYRSVSKTKTEKDPNFIALYGACRLNLESSFYDGL